MSKLKPLKYINIFLLISAVIGCNNNVGNNNSNSTTQALITIDNAGSVPILNNKPTTSVIYVHNNSNINISNISYTASHNSKNSEEEFLDPNSVNTCSTIKAGQSCALVFTTPSLETPTTQGSTIINLSYNTNSNKTNSFSRIINYTIVPNTQANGVIASSGVLLTNTSNDNMYGTFYIYASGSNTNYLIKDIISNNNNVKITQGNIKNKQVQSNFIQAIEISTPSKNIQPKDINGYNASIIIRSSTENTTLNYSSTANITASPITNGAILISGQVPIINTAQATPNGSLYITNSGNSEATIDTIDYPTDITASSGVNQCGNTLPAESGCIIYFNVTQGNGSGNITVPYTTTTGGNSGTLDQTIVWYNGKGAPLLSMNSNTNPISFTQSQNESAIITVTNIGGYNLTNIQATAEATGQAVVSTSNLICNDINGDPTGTSLLIGGNCTYQVLISDNTVETGSITTKINSNYGSSNTYSRVFAINYTSNMGP